MTVSFDPSLIQSYHVHIYYELNSKDIASQLHEEFTKHKWSHGFSSKQFHVGDMHDAPIGPHTKPMFRLAIEFFNFHSIVNHLMLHRKGLSVLIHPETGYDLKDHTDHAMWLGTPVALDLSKL